MIRILVADDHPIVANGLRHLLQKAPGMVVAGEATTAEAALKMLRQGRFDLLILDISIPEMGGLEALKRIKAAKIPVPVLMLSMYPEEHYALRTLKLGASGYLGKENMPDEVVGAILKVVRGGRYLSPALRAELLDDGSPARKKPPHEALSPREYQVMCLLASGKTVGAIAKALGLSVKTIDTYRAHILEKLKLRNNVELARYALENRLAF